MIASAMFNMPIDTDPQQQEAASPQIVVVRSSLRWALNTVSINKHFKTEGWLIPALMALPIAIGLIAAIFFA